MDHDDRDDQALKDLQEEVGGIRRNLGLRPGGASAGGGDGFLQGLGDGLCRAAAAAAVRRRDAAIARARQLRLPASEREGADAADKPQLTDVIDRLVEQLLKEIAQDPQAQETTEARAMRAELACCKLQALAGLVTAAAAGAGGADGAGMAGAAGGAGGTGGAAGTGRVIGDGGSNTAPDAALVCVRGDTAIWGWNGAAQDWRMFDFAEDIIDVQTGGDGFLALSSSKAVLFDSSLGIFLKPLQAGGAQVGAYRGLAGAGVPRRATRRRAGRSCPRVGYDSRGRIAIRSRRRRAPR